jgi:hypothetical protein
MSIIFGFAPFIAFFALASLVSPLVGLTTAFAISLLMTGLNWQRGKSLKILDVGSLVLFGSMILIILVAAPDWSVGEVGLAVNGGLTLISLLSLAIGCAPSLCNTRKSKYRSSIGTHPCSSVPTNSSQSSGR